MSMYSTMRSYSSTCTTTSIEEPTLATTSSAAFDIDVDRARKRRRHSSYQPRSWSIERESVQVLVDQFLADLGKRLELVETYGHTKIDEGMSYAYDTLQDVHESCMHVGGDIVDAGRKRAKVLVDTLDSHYRGALARRETLEHRVREGVKICESMLSDFEQRAYARKSSFASAANEMLDTGAAYADQAASKAAEIVSDGAEAARRAKEVLKTKIEEAAAHAREHGLITYDLLPEPWRVNPHILSGYRFSETKLDCVRSCFRLSNEMVNIWTHFLGLLLVLTIAFYVYPSTPAFASATNFDILIASTFFFAASKCLICSIVWHAMSSISNQTLMERFACVDYTGISLLVAASIMTTEYTAFYCEPTSRWLYLSTTLVLGTAGTILPWHPTFNRADMAWLRVGFFVSLALTGFVPVLQLTYERGWDETAYFYAPITKSVLVYFFGAVLYAAKIPERYLPGWFDYVGGSHNIWHIAVLGGILFHYTAMQRFFSEAYRRAGTACSVY
ncbi:inc metabolism membrane protein [Friedmanniomyces endolithicus]|nr:inc metabolism membrane protein [Friedmanniomyces endolithicus]KAK0770543.1 inc metabolism membrane protein [Friedmanniomyces endolithicus]KAK0776357.1 inc metabolism membrane protein [Friedmanniomyces endolithicus]KAK0783135.1 inc metabolism membrane protein [Friedmanniomyces endolithicus]KAK0835400.1 inc metabolism membrane protein [Friedmanniomyces endolithicus]